MRLIDEIHLKRPFYGSRRMCDELEDRGYKVNRKRVQRLMRLMDLRALYPRRRTSQPGKGHKIYPYLLRDLSIERANQAWATDICYIPMAKGFMYPGGHHGLAFTPGAVMAGVEHIGYGLLHRSARGGIAAVWHAGNLQHRPRVPVHLRGVHRRAQGPGASTSAWMARVGGWTTCSSSACGAASSTRMCTCTPTKRQPNFRAGWPGTSSSTTPGADTARWTDAPGGCGVLWPGRPRIGSLKTEEDFTYGTVQVCGSISFCPLWRRLVGDMHGSLGIPPLVEPRSAERFPYHALQRRIFDQRTHHRGITVYVVRRCGDGHQNDPQKHFHSSKCSA